MRYAHTAACVSLRALRRAAPAVHRDMHGRAVVRRGARRQLREFDELMAERDEARRMERWRGSKLNSREPRPRAELL